MVKRKQRPFNSRTVPLKKTRLLPVMYNRDKQEYKVTDTAVIQSGCTAAGSIISLTSNLVRGTSGLNNFVGRKISPVSLQIRYSVVGPGTPALIPVGPDIYNNSRIIVFQWFGQTVPVPLDIVMTVGTTQAPFSAIQVNYQSKIRVLHDKMITTYVNNYDGTSTTSTSENGKCYIKARRMEPIDFATNVIAIPETGNIYIMYISDSTLTPNPIFNFYSRLTFND